jgi:TPP-dependent pyruvate/acetoin dehydrogenase alpha subunit
MLTMDERVALYRTLLLIRQAEEAIRAHYASDDMKTPVHLGIGGEAISVGVCHCLPAKARTFGTYRNHALYLAMTGDVDGFFAELFGKASGPGKGKAGSMHLCRPDRGLTATSAVVATTIPLAVGSALANAYRKDPTPVAVFFGDGAAEEGVFWESINFACLHRLQILFVCEDNGLAIHAQASERRGYRSLIDVLQGFRCTVASADGSDVPAVVEATRHMLSRMRQDRQPGFLHLPYFRLLEHVGIQEDFSAGYRSRPSSEEWKQIDPVERMRAELEALGYPSSDLEAVKTSIDEQIAAGIARARAAAYPPAEALYQDVLA